MAASLFLDTNILIYAIELDGPDPGKSESARRLLRRENLILSTQVLGEFYSAVTSRRRKSPLSHEEAVAWVQLWKRWEIQQITLATVDLALEFVARFKIAYYDGLILATARLAGCEKVYSEDLNPGQNYRGVQVVNPFASEAQ
jgi:predicted nucleic acid-binding protein